jgi:hypothetical protein
MGCDLHRDALHYALLVPFLSFPFASLPPDSGLVVEIIWRGQNEPTGCFVQVSQEYIVE